MLHVTLAAIGLERRTVSIAILHRTNLGEVIWRQLSGDPMLAARSVADFIYGILLRQSIEFLAFQRLHADATDWMLNLHSAALQAAREAGVPMMEVEEKRTNGGIRPSATHNPLTASEGWQVDLAPALGFPAAENLSFLAQIGA